MAKAEINIKEIEQYLYVFGYAKFQQLWKEFCECSTQNWQNLKTLSLDEKKYIFHNWRAGSKIFGMDEFANLCQKTEDCIINCRTDKVQSLINKCQHSYECQIVLVEEFLLRKDAENDE